MSASTRKHSSLKKKGTIRGDAVKKLSNKQLLQGLAEALATITDFQRQQKSKTPSLEFLRQILKHYQHKEHTQAKWGRSFDSSARDLADRSLLEWSYGMMGRVISLQDAINAHKAGSPFYGATLALWSKTLGLMQVILENSQLLKESLTKLCALDKTIGAIVELLKVPLSPERQENLAGALNQLRNLIEGPYLQRPENSLLAAIFGLGCIILGAAFYLAGIILAHATMVGGVVAIVTSLVMMTFAGITVSNALSADMTKKADKLALEKKSCLELTEQVHQTLYQINNKAGFFALPPSNSGPTPLGGQDLHLLTSKVIPS